MRLGLVVLGSALVLVGVLVAASHIPALLIDTVTVVGAESVASSTVRANINELLRGFYIHALPKRNIFLYPQERIEESLMRAYPAFASVDAYAVDFSTIAINIVERNPRALWCQEGKCFFMDENGMVYADSPIFSEPIYISYSGAAEGRSLPKQYLTPTQFQSLAALVDAIAQRLPEEQVKGVHVDAAGDVRIFFESGFILLFALRDEGGDIFERFTLALTAEPLTTHTLPSFEYLDLRFGDKLYYKLKGE